MRINYNYIILKTWDEFKLIIEEVIRHRIMMELLVGLDILGQKDG